MSPRSSATPRNMVSSTTIQCNVWWHMDACREPCVRVAYLLASEDELGWDEWHVSGEWCNTMLGCWVPTKYISHYQTVKIVTSNRFLCKAKLSIGLALDQDFCVHPEIWVQTLCSIHYWSMLSDTQLPDWLLHHINTFSLLCLLIIPACHQLRKEYFKWFKKC